MLFLVQFLVARRWKWSSALVANALAWVALICWLVVVGDRQHTPTEFFEVLVFFGLFAIMPFLLGSIIGTVVQLLVAVLYRKLLQNK